MKKEKQNDKLFNFDNEIIIGVKKNEDKKTTKAKTKKNRKKNLKLKQDNLTEKRRKRIVSFIKGVLLITLTIGILIFLMLSPLFNIEKIMVENNTKMTTEEVIDLSEINIGDNIFKINKSKVEKKLKQNTYIESIQLERKLPSEITINIKERKATYILELETGEFAYINNQGYILEIKEVAENLPKLAKYSTENIVVGERLNNIDLEKLEVVLKIMEIANANQIGYLITQINIENMNNIILRLDSEKKTVYLGDASDINTKILYIKVTLEDEKGIEGEIFMDGKTNKEGEFLFREKV